MWVLTVDSSITSAVAISWLERPRAISARALAGQWLPGLVHGLSFALTSLFVVLAIDACRAGRNLSDPILAVGCAPIAAIVAPGQMLLAAMGLYVVGLLARYRSTLDREAVRA